MKFAQSDYLSTIFFANVAIDLARYTSALYYIARCRYLSCIDFPEVCRFLSNFQWIKVQKYIATGCLDKVFVYYVTPNRKWISSLFL